MLDGAKNMVAIKKMPNWATNYPAFKYWDDKGFYIPAKNELQTIFNNYATIKTAVEKNGGTFNFLNNNSIYSSTEVSMESCLELVYLSGNQWFVERTKVIKSPQRFTLGIKKF